MTTSALLSASHRFHVLSSATSVTARRSPIYSVRPLIPCCGPYAGGSSDCFGRFLHRWPGLHPFCKGSATTFIHAPDYAWSFSRRCNLRFMLRPGTLLAPLRTGRLLPSLHAARSPRPHVDYDYTSFRLARGRTFTGRSDSLMGCTQNRTVVPFSRTKTVHFGTKRGGVLTLPVALIVCGPSTLNQRLSTLNLLYPLPVRSHVR